MTSTTAEYNIRARHHDLGAMLRTYWLLLALEYLLDTTILHSVLFPCPLWIFVMLMGKLPIKVLWLQADVYLLRDLGHEGMGLAYFAETLWLRRNLRLHWSITLSLPFCTHLLFLFCSFITNDAKVLLTWAPSPQNLAPTHAVPPFGSFLPFPTPCSINETDNLTKFQSKLTYIDSFLLCASYSFFMLGCD